MKSHALHARLNDTVGQEFNIEKQYQMSKKLLTVLAVLLATLANAQDTIVRRDSVRIVAKVTNIAQRTISYQRYGHSEGPSYDIPRADVSRIIYADGTSEKFGKNSGVIPTISKKNNVSVTITDAVSGMLTVNYERILWNDLGVRLSASRGMLAGQTQRVGYSGYNTYYSRFKPISLTLDIHYYAAHSSSLSYYIGAAMEYGQSQQSGWWGGCFPPYPSEPRTVSYYMAGVTNGITFRTNAPISLELYSTIGAKREADTDYLRPAMRVGFNVGYRF